MENVPFDDISQIDDISTIDEYKVALESGLSEKEAFEAVCRYSRDNTRVPFQWDDSNNAGFSTGTPWLSISNSYPSINLKSQEADTDSVYHYYKKLIALRKEKRYRDTFIYGTVQPVYLEKERLMAYYREGEDQTILIIGNFKKEEEELQLEKPYRNVLLNNERELKGDQTKLLLSGYQVLVLEI